MTSTIDITPGCDTFATINGCRVRLGRGWRERVTAEELSDRFARTFRELGATPLVMNPTGESVFGAAERADGSTDLYTVTITHGLVRGVYLDTITREGTREHR